MKSSAGALRHLARDLPPITDSRALVTGRLASVSLTWLLLGSEYCLLFTVTIPCL